MEDGIVEVVGINGAYHEALVRSHLSAGVRLGRGKQINIKITKALEIPMAVKCKLITTLVLTHLLNSLMENLSSNHQPLSTFNDLDKLMSWRILKHSRNCNQNNDNDNNNNKE